MHTLDVIVDAATHIITHARRHAAKRPHPLDFVELCRDTFSTMQSWGTTNDVVDDTTLVQPEYIIYHMIYIYI